MSFLSPPTPKAPPPPPIPATMASGSVAASGNAARQAAAAAAGSVNGFGRTVNTSAQGAAPTQMPASKALFG